MARTTASLRPEPDQLWNRYIELRRVDDRNALVTHYAALATTEAARLARRLSNRVSFDEIRCAALDGLLRAVESYNPARPTPFRNYCRRRMTGAVLDWLRSLDVQGRTVRRFVKQCNRTRDALGGPDGNAANEAELATSMGISQKRFNRLAARARAGNVIPFTALEHQLCGHGDGGPAWDVADPRALGPEAHAARSLLTEMITRGLSREEKLVLTLYYHENLTMAEIGAVLELSESRISQIHADVLRRLRQRFGERLREELCA